MTSAELDAEEHYRLGGQLLDRAEVASDAGDFARVHDLCTRARTHYVAAQAACAIWPGDPMPELPTTSPDSQPDCPDGFRGKTVAVGLRDTPPSENGSQGLCPAVPPVPEPGS